jgi:hypothetical protein
VSLLTKEKEKVLISNSTNSGGEGVTKLGRTCVRRDWPVVHQKSHYFEQLWELSNTQKKRTEAK